MPIAISSSVNGNLVPNTATYPDSVTNGEFLIQGNRIATLVGDGIDEATTWTFDFSADPKLHLMNLSSPLTSARLTLTLTLTRPNNVLGTDVVGIEGLADIPIPGVRSLRRETTTTVNLELLSYPGYSSTQILQVLAANANRVSMRYANDAIVSAAKLELTQNDPRYSYLVKFMCGESDGTSVAPGSYFTTVNLHNPNCHDVCCRYRLSSPNQPGEVSTFNELRLRPGESSRIDCEQIRKQSESDHDFAEGFVVVENGQALDVVAIYTAGAQEVRTLHTERIEPRIGALDGSPLEPGRSTEFVYLPNPVQGLLPSDVVGTWSGRFAAPAVAPGVAGLGQQVPIALEFSDLGGGSWALAGGGFFTTGYPSQGGLDWAILEGDVAFFLEAPDRPAQFFFIGTLSEDSQRMVGRIRYWRDHGEFVHVGTFRISRSGEG